MSDEQFVRNYLTPIYKKPTELKYDEMDFSQVRQYHINSNYLKSGRPTKCQLVAYVCTGSCYKNNPYGHCKLVKIDQYCSQSTVESCPYHIVTLNINEPRSNNYNFKSFHDLIYKLRLRKVFGDYTEWVLENKDIVNITDEEFEQLTSIKEFQLEYLTRSRHSYQEFINKIMEDMDYNWEQDFFSGFNCSASMPTIINTLICKYKAKLSATSAGRKMLPFMDDEIRQYEDFKRNNPDFIIHIGKYYFSAEYCFSNLWEYAKKEDKYLYKERFDLNFNQIENRRLDFYFTEEQVTDVIHWAREAQSLYYQKEYKYLIELCEQLQLYLELKNDLIYKNIIVNPIDEPKKWRAFIQMYEEKKLENK